MNNRRLLTGLLSAVLLSSGVCSYGRTVMTLEEIFEAAEANSAQLRPYFAAEEEAKREISVARSERLPEINASLTLSYIGDGFTTKRNFSDYQRAPIPHLGDGLAVNLRQPLYTGGAIKNSIELAELKSTAARYASELQRDNIRFRLTGFYLDIYKYSNLRTVVENNIAQARKVLAEMRARYEMLSRQRAATSSVVAETRQRIAQNDAGIELAKALLETAELNLSYCVIVAPCDGYTSRKEIEVGQLVQPGQTLLDVVDSHDVWVTANYKETQLPRIAPGSKVEMKVDAIPGVTFSGEVVSISRATCAALSVLPQDNSAGNFVKVRQRVPVRIAFSADNDKAAMERLRAGMNVECEVKY